MIIYDQIWSHMIKYVHIYIWWYSHHLHFWSFSTLKKTFSKYIICSHSPLCVNFSFLVNVTWDECNFTLVLFYCFLNLDISTQCHDQSKIEITVDSVVCLTNEDLKNRQSCIFSNDSRYIYISTAIYDKFTKDQQTFELKHFNEAIIKYLLDKNTQLSKTYYFLKKTAQDQLLCSCTLDDAPKQSTVLKQGRRVTDKALVIICLHSLNIFPEKNPLILLHFSGFQS